MPTEIVPAPIIRQGPITSDPMKNAFLGAGITALPNAGFGAALTGLDPIGAAANTGTAVFLNFIVAQPLKKIKSFPEQSLLQPVMFVVAFLALYFIVFHSDMGKAFITAATSTATAVANYKADKAAGTNLMASTPPDKEFGNEPSTTGVVSQTDTRTSASSPVN